MVIGIGAEPDGAGVGTEERVGLRMGDDATARGEDGPSVFLEEILKHLYLEAAVGILAVEVEDLSDAEACCEFDESVQLEKGQAQARGQSSTDGALSCPAQPEERDDPLVITCEERLGFLQETGRALAEGGCDGGEANDGDVSSARLELGDIALGERAAGRQFSDGETSFEAKLADALAERV